MTLSRLHFILAIIFSFLSVYLFFMKRTNDASWALLAIFIMAVMGIAHKNKEKNAEKANVEKDGQRKAAH